VNRTLAEFQTLSGAEALLEFFNLEYEPSALASRRVAVLRQFSLAVREIDRDRSFTTETERLDRYQVALQTAYESAIADPLPSRNLRPSCATSCSSCGSLTSNSCEPASL